MQEGFVNIADHGLLGKGFYWHRYADYGFTREDLENIGIHDDAIWVDAKIIPALLAVDEELKQKGWKLYLKEGYRSPELYNLVYESRVRKFGQEMTDKLLNIAEMPHAKGTVVDAAIWDENTDAEVYLRKKEDGPESLIFGYYENASDMEGKRCHELQVYLIDLMQRHGFGMGKRGEFFHFEYLD